ncbi:hypothetical protein L9F63_009978 [Diploptera punctata]|uniref:Uncharacterized protein n=1 Tax=Diploptera punctata TaxID=6984 RepID=A0AAD8AIZ5_DIPPU|nr:hypothetical protein L9F63_009978 [Diploptera punctata]
MDFVFNDNAAKTNWMQNNTFLLDADFSHKDPKNRMFVTTPKFLNGVPASLSTVADEQSGNPLVPYPSWDSHSDTDCSKMISVLRVKISDCGQLWVLDSGVANVLQSFNATCPPKLLIFDLKTDQEIWRYQIPDKDFVMNSLLGTVELNGDCGKEHAYLADITGYGIVVVDRHKEISWRVQNQLTTFDPDATQYNTGGQIYTLTDGVMSLQSSSKLLYFHSLSSRKENWVPLDVINNEKNFVNNNSTRGFVTSPGERSGQSGPEVLDSQGDVMLFSNAADSSLYCWKTSTEYVTDNLHRVFQNDETFKFVSGMKMIEDNLLVASCPFGNIMNGNVDVNKVNYYILKAPIKKLLSKTPCIQ